MYLPKLIDMSHLSSLELHELSPNTSIDVLGSPAATISRLATYTKFIELPSTGASEIPGMWDDA